MSRRLDICAIGYGESCIACVGSQTFVVHPLTVTLLYASLVVGLITVRYRRARESFGYLR
jgi:hypothetical protein